MSILRMSTGRSLRLILSSVLLFLAVAGAMAARERALAAGLITLSVNEGQPGTGVEVDGSGFVANTAVRVYFAADLAGIGTAIDTKVTAYELVGEMPIDSQARFARPLSFAVPSTLEDGKVRKNVVNGNYYIYVTYANSKTIEARQDFFILGPVVVNPNHGKIGDYVAINGAGLKTNTPAWLYFSSDAVQVGAAIDSDVTAYQNIWNGFIGADGTLGGGVSFKIPARLSDGKYPEDVHGGDYYIYLAYYGKPKTVITINRFSVYGGQIAIEPQEGNVGSEVKITGQDLKPGQQLTVRYDGDILPIKSGDGQTDSAGHFTCRVQVPESTTGSHEISVSDVTGNEPSAYFTVKPSLSLPGTVTAGATVTLQGHGFRESQEMFVAVNGIATATSPAIIVTNRKGGFSASFKMPGAAGQATVVVQDKEENKAQTVVTVAPAPAASATLSLYPATSEASPGYVGQPLTVSGANFEPGTAVTVTYDQPEVTVPPVTTDAEGNFQVSLLVPAGTSGPHTITASDTKNTAAATFVLESQPPPPPMALVPEVASGVKPTTSFDWSDVEDPSGVTYTFEVALDEAFTKRVLERTGLKTSAYSLQKQEQLDLKGRQTGYYWRVRAVDGANNQSTWSVPVHFYVGSAHSAFPWWSAPLLGLLGLALAGSIAVWIVRVQRAKPK